MGQDFGKQIKIVVRRDVPSWQVLNTVAHISAYFGNRLGDEFGTGKYFVTHDGLKLPRNSQYGIVILAGDASELGFLVERAAAAQVAWMGFIREMIDLVEDTEIQAKLTDAHRSDIDYLGVGLFGEQIVLKELTKQFRLWK